MKKKYFAVVAIAASTIINAQNGQLVGINTSTPTNTLDVNGTVRVRTLPNKFDPATDKVVIADDKGVLKAVPTREISSPAYEVLFDMNTLGTAVINDSDPNASNQRTPVTIQSQSITLTRDALVQVNFSVPVDQVYGYGTSNAPIDGKAKMLRTHLVIDNTIVTRSTNTYTNGRLGTGTGTDSEALGGVFYNTGSYFVKLAAGTHTIKLEGICNPYIMCRQGGNIQGARFQAMALYNQ